MPKFQKQFLSAPELAERWGYELATIRNGVCSGRLPLKPHRLFPNGDPRFLITDVEAHEAKSREAGA